MKFKIDDVIGEVGIVLDLPLRVIDHRVGHRS
jgi:hypothetical protein